MSDKVEVNPLRKTIKGFIAALEIFAKYFPEGGYKKCALDGQHDIIYVYVDADTLPEESEDGIVLGSLGWHISSETDTWAYFT